MPDYLLAARSAVTYTRKVMDIGAANKMAPWDFYGKLTKGLCAGTAISKGAMQERVDADMALLNREKALKNPGQNPPPVAGYDEYVNVMAYWARQFGCGNCGPHSAVAFVYLRDLLKTLPLDWMMYNNFQHAWVIVGRRSDTDPEDFTTWNRDAAICDSWRGRGEAEPVFPYAWLRLHNKQLNLLHRAE